MPWSRTRCAATSYVPGLRKPVAGWSRSGAATRCPSVSGGSTPYVVTWMSPVPGKSSTRSVSTRSRARSGAQRRGSAANRPSTRRVRGRPRFPTWPGGSGTTAPRSPPVATTPSSSATAAASSRPAASNTRQAATATSHATTKTSGIARAEMAIPAPKAAATGASGVRLRLTRRWSRRRGASRLCGRSSRGRARDRRFARRDLPRHACRRSGGPAPARSRAAGSARPWSRG